MFTIGVRFWGILGHLTAESADGRKTQRMQRKDDLIVDFENLSKTNTVDALLLGLPNLNFAYSAKTLRVLCV